MVIDSRPFNGPDVRQYPDRFDGYRQLIVDGFPSTAVPRVLGRPNTCADLRDPYNHRAVRRGKPPRHQNVHTAQRRVSGSPEQGDRRTNHVPVAVLWHMGVMQGKFGDRVVHCPRQLFRRTSPGSRGQPRPERAPAVPAYCWEAGSRRPQWRDAADVRHAAQPGGLRARGQEPDADRALAQGPADHVGLIGAR